MGGDLGWLIGVALNITGSLCINAGTNLMKLGHNRRARDIAAQVNLQSKTSVLSKSKTTKEHEASLTNIQASRVSLHSTASDSSATDSTQESHQQLRPIVSTSSDESKATIVNIEERKNATKNKPIYKYPIWWVGMAGFIIGNILNFASFGFAAQSLLSALGAIQFVSNVIFARFVLKERVTWTTLFATSIIIGACLLLVFFGSRTSVELNAELAIELYHGMYYSAYLIALAVLAPIFYALYRLATWVDSRPIKTNSKAKTNALRALTLSRPIVYALYAAMIGTQSVLFGKTVSELIATTARGTNQFTHWYTYVAMVCLAITAIFWVYHLNKGLRLFPAVLIVPTMQIAWTLLSIVSGGLYYREFQSFEPLDFGMFALGVVLILIGVVLLTVTTTKGGKPNEVAPIPPTEAARQSVNARASVATTATKHNQSSTTTILEVDLHAQSFPSSEAVLPTSADISDQISQDLPLRAMPSTATTGTANVEETTEDTPAVVAKETPRKKAVVIATPTPVTPSFARREHGLMRHIWREGSLLARQSLGLDDNDSIALGLMAMPVTTATHCQPVATQQDDELEMADVAMERAESKGNENNV